MPVIPNLTPGMVVATWPDYASEQEPGTPQLRLFSGEHAPKEAKRWVMDSLSKPGAGPVRAFVLLEMFHQQAGGQIRRIPDDWAPVLDLILREQLAGKGFQLKPRGPPREKPDDLIARLAEEKYAAKQIPPPCSCGARPYGLDDVKCILHGGG